MKAIGVIPARYGSTRFPGKALALLGGRPMIQHVYENSARAHLLDDLLVATDDERIADVIRRSGGQAVMTSPEHPSGTDRVAEAVRGLEADVVVNIQGDEPFISAQAIDQVIAPFRKLDHLEMSTLMCKIEGDKKLNDPNVVKVVVDRQGYALYFSRSLIPYPRLRERFRAYEHIGLYAYRKSFLLSLAQLPPGELEFTEGLEQLRVLENGHRILAIRTEHHLGLSVDTPADLENAERFLAGSQGSQQ